MYYYIEKQVLLYRFKNKNIKINLINISFIKILYK